MTNEAIVPAQSDNPWRTGLDGLLSEYDGIWSAMFDALEGQGSERDNCARAANETAPHVIQARVEAWKQRLLSWACERYVEIVPTEPDIARHLFQKRQQQGLALRITTHVDSFRGAMHALHLALAGYVQWLDENASAGALIGKGLKNFLAGFTGDIGGVIDGVVDAVQGVESGNAAQQQLQQALQAAAQVSDTVHTSIDNEVVDWWNNHALADAETARQGGFKTSAMDDALGGLVISSGVTLVLLLIHWIVVGVFMRDGLVSAGIGELIVSARPLWIYIVGGIICVLMALLMGRGWLGKLGVTALFLVGLHVETQLVGWGMLAWLGKSPQEVAANATPSTSAPAAPPPSPLAGRWSSQSGLTLEATIRAEGQVALRIVEPGKPASAGYRTGDVYATLKPSASGGYAVEYRFRPMPPAGLSYDKAATDTCQEVVSDVRGKPLTANLDGDKLTVQLARIDVAPTSFKLQGLKILECKQLNKTNTAVIELVLDRAAASTTTSSRPISVDDLPPAR